MKPLVRILLCAGLLTSAPHTAFAQEDYGKLTGNFQFDAQYYNKDSVIQAPNVPEKILSNGWLNLTYTRGNFSAGLRYESYLNPIQGFDINWKGQGIPYRYATYQNEDFAVTVGNFYEQFGSGMIFRSYEERALGIDNAMEGIRFKMFPTKGVSVTGILGKQRSFFALGAGIVRGADASADLHEIFPSLADNDIRLQVGASIVSKFQADQDPTLKLPENVAAGAGRITFGIGNFSLYSEVAYKANDPSFVNRRTFNPGNALFLQSTYAEKGFSVSFSAKRIDNMDFRSDRSATVNNLTMSFLPPLSKQHTYRLVTLFPYATQPNGEVGIQADVLYELPKGSLLGGKYGTSIAVNYSRVQNTDTTRIDEFTYDHPFFSAGKRTYFQDLNIEISRRWSPTVKTIFSYMNFQYDKEIIEGKPGAPKLGAQIFVADVSYKLSPTTTLRGELQHLWASNPYIKEYRDNPELAKDPAFLDHFAGSVPNMENWIFGLLELTVAPQWYFTMFNEYNYENPDESKRVNYFSGQVAFVHDSKRISIGYGRQRAGILCVGGVCRNVPAMNGFSLSISGTF